MGHGLVIGSTRLFAAADFLLWRVESEKRGCAANAWHLAGAAADRWTRKSAFTTMELAEALDLLIRMGFLSSEARRR